MIDVSRPQAGPPLGAERGWRSPERLAYLATTLAALIPVWVAPMVVSQDGGSRLYNAHVLAAMLAGQAPHYDAIYVINWSAAANWIDHLLLAALASLVPAAIAEKLLVSGYLLLFAGAVRYAAGAIRRDHAWVAHLALPLLFTFSVHMGLYNFILSFPLYFLSIGFVWRHRDGRPVWVIAVLLLLIYLLHPLAWIFSVTSLAVIAVAGARDAHVHGHASPAHVARRLGRLGIAALPGALLLLVLVDHDTTDMTRWQPVLDLLRHVYLAGPLWSFGPFDDVLGAVVFGVLTVVSVYVWRTRRDYTAAALAWTTVAYLLLVLALPSQWRSLEFVTERAGTFGLFTWILALAGGLYSPRARAAIVVAAQVLALTCLARWTIVGWQLAPYAREYASVAERIAEGTRVLALNFATRGREGDRDRLVHPVAPLAHVDGFIGARRNAIIVNDYEAMTRVFPVTYRIPVSDLLDASLHEPPDVSLATIEAWERRLCQSIDYVILWQADDRDDRVRRLIGELEENYDLAHVSTPGGHARLYRRVAAAPCRERP